ncbi:MAG: hypothetical protein AAGJ54_08185 [Planctomycetota bacterium]
MENDALQVAGIIVGLVGGVVGTTLGILNYLDARRAAKPRLRIRMGLAHILPGNLLLKTPKAELGQTATIEVANTGLIPVRLSLLGCADKLPGGESIAFPKPISIHGKVPPCALEPGDRIIVGISTRQLLEHQEKARLPRGYVTTEIGDYFRQSRRDARAFRWMLDDLAAEIKRSQEPNSQVS